MRRLHLILGLLVLAGYALHAVAWVSAGALNPDEGYYALAARSVFAGSIPYRDFGYSQLPGFPYLQGLVLSIAGHGLLEQRSVNALWGGSTLLLATYLAWRRTRPGRDWVWPLLALAMLPSWVYFVVIGKTYALTGLLLILAAGALELQRPGLRIAGVALCGSLAVACRLPVAPAVIVLWAALYRGVRGHSQRRLALWAPPLVGLLLVLPFVAAAPDGFMFWNFGLHGSVLRSSRLASAQSLLAYHLPSLLALLLVSRQPPARWPPALWAGALGSLGMLLPQGGYAEYVTPCLPLLALGIAQLGTPARRTLSGGLLRLALVTAPLLAPNPDLRTDPGLIADLTGCARHLAGSAPAGAVVLTSEPLIATGAGLEVLPGLEFSPFAVTEEMLPERAARLRLVTIESLRARIASGEADLVVLSRVHVNWPRSVPSLRRIPAERLNVLLTEIERRYRPTWHNASYVVLSRAPGDHP